MVGKIPDDKRRTAEELIRTFLPMLERFEENSVDYCLVGGIAVLVHCLADDVDRLRATTDADVMVSQGYSNQDFASDYLAVYASSPEFSKSVYEALLGDGGFEELGKEENAFVNVSFVGAVEDLDGIETPDFDVCRTLNRRTLGTIERERLTLCGMPVWVATVDELLGMKRDTIAIYGCDASVSPKPQDFVDEETLRMLRGLR